MTANDALGASEVTVQLQTLLSLDNLKCGWFDTTTFHIYLYWFCYLELPNTGYHIM